MHNVERMSDVESSTTIPPELRSTICPNCGYSLAGISSDASCPECGRRRDDSEVVLYGYPAGGNPKARTKTSRYFGMALVLAIIVVLSFIATDWLLIGVILLFAGWALLERLDRRHPGVCQVRILPEGVIQFSHGGMMTAVQRLRVRFLWIVPLFAPPIAAVWICARGTRQMLDPVVAAWIVATPLGIMWARDALYYLRSRKRFGATSLADCNMALYRLTKWSSIRRIVVTPIGPNIHRLQLKKRQAFYTLDNSSHVVDADVELSNDAACILRALLISRCTEVKKPSIPGQSDVSEAIEQMRSET